MNSLLRFRDVTSFHNHRIFVALQSCVVYLFIMLKGYISVTCFLHGTIPGAVLKVLGMNC